jgi:hypothetical protein
MRKLRIWLLLCIVLCLLSVPMLAQAGVLLTTSGCQYVTDGMGTIVAARYNSPAPALYAVRVGGSTTYIFTYRHFTINQSVTIDYMKCWNLKSAWLRITRITPFDG